MTLAPTMVAQAWNPFPVVWQILGVASSSSHDHKPDKKHQGRWTYFGSGFKGIDGVREGLAAGRGSRLWRQKCEAACLHLDRLANRGTEPLPLSLVPSDPHPRVRPYFIPKVSPILPHQQCHQLRTKYSNKRTYGSIIHANRSD